MKKVSSDEFYNTIGKLDVTVTPIGNFPYTTEFRLRDRTLVGIAKPCEELSILAGIFDIDEYFIV